MVPGQPQEFGAPGRHDPPQLQGPPHHCPHPVAAEPEPGQDRDEESNVPIVPNGGGGVFSKIKDRFKPTN